MAIRTMQYKGLNLIEYRKCHENPSAGVLIVERPIGRRSRLNEIGTVALDARDTAFQDIFREYYPLVYRVALRSTSNPAEAEDIAQEVFARLFRHWPKLRIRISLSAWLTRTAINLAFNNHRGRRRLFSLRERLKGLAPESAPSPEERLLAGEERRTAQSALAKLRPRDRDILVARYSGLNYREVAEVVGVKAGSVGTLLTRAEGRFQREYEGLTEGDRR